MNFLHSARRVGYVWVGVVALWRRARLGVGTAKLYSFSGCARGARGWEKYIWVRADRPSRVFFTQERGSRDDGDEIATLTATSTLREKNTRVRVIGYSIPHCAYAVYACAVVTCVYVYVEIVVAEIPWIS